MLVRAMWAHVQRVVGLPTIRAEASGVVRALRRLLTALASSLPAVLWRWWPPRLTQATAATQAAVASPPPPPQPRYFALFKPYMVLCSWEADAPCKNGRAPRTTLADLGLPAGAPQPRLLPTAPLSLACYRALSYARLLRTRGLPCVRWTCICLPAVDEVCTC